MQIADSALLPRLSRTRGVPLLLRSERFLFIRSLMERPSLERSSLERSSLKVLTHGHK